MSENAGYEAPMNVNAGYEAPVSENAGYEAPINVNAGYEAPINVNAGYEAPLSDNAGYEDPIKSMSDKTFVSSSPALPQRNNIVVVEGPDGYLKPPALVPMTQGKKLVEETESQRNLGEYELYDKSTKSEEDATKVAEVQGENELNQHDSSVCSSDGTSFSTAGNKNIPSVENVTLAV
uniref:Uncharacterized protein n=1 Tax=Ciona savignyi TaxID=51511 RepID=H2ZQX4_CIOSA